MKIAVYAIALNEIKHLDRFVKGCAGADQIVIVDTGSTDGTWEALQEYPVEAHRASLSPFRFDEARNIALGYVDPSVDICVSLDLDEVPDEGFFDKLRKAWKPDTGRAWVMWDTGTIWANNLRVHSRKGYAWKYPCHEVTYPLSGEEHDVTVDTCVRHLPDDSKSRGSYLGLLELGHAENPQDHRMLTYLIREYYMHQRWTDVIEHCKKLECQTGGWDVEIAQSWRMCGQSYRNLGDDAAGYEWFKRGAETAPTELEAWFPLAYMHYESGNWQQCYDAAIMIEMLPKRTRVHHIVDETIEWRMYDVLAIACWNLDKKGSAKRYARIAYELNPEEQRLKDNYDYIVKHTVKEYKNGM